MGALLDQALASGPESLQTVVCVYYSDSRRCLACLQRSRPECCALLQVEARPYKKMCLLPAILLCQCYVNYWPLGSKPRVCEKSIKSFLFFFCRLWRFVWVWKQRWCWWGGDVCAAIFILSSYCCFKNSTPAGGPPRTHCSYTSLSSTHCGAGITVLKVNYVL